VKGAILHGVAPFFMAMSGQPGDTPRKRSDLRRSSSSVVSSMMDRKTRIVATARIVSCRRLRLKTE